MSPPHLFDDWGKGAKLSWDRTQVLRIAQNQSAECCERVVNLALTVTSACHRRRSGAGQRACRGVNGTYQIRFCKFLPYLRSGQTLTWEEPASCTCRRWSGSKKHARQRGAPSWSEVLCTMSLNDEPSIAFQTAGRTPFGNLELGYACSSATQGRCRNERPASHY